MIKLLVLILYSLDLSQVWVRALPNVFSSEPKDVCSAVGQHAFFPCIYNGTSVPSISWRINGVIRSSARLPFNHCLNDTGLVVYADASTNQSTYSCIVRLLSQSGEVLMLESNSAVLSVIAITPMSACNKMMKIINTPTPSMLLKHSHSITMVTIQANISTKYQRHNNNIIIITSISQVSSIMPVEVHQHSSKVQEISIGITCGGIFLLLLILILVSIGIFVKLKKIRTHTEKDREEPVYEEIFTSKSNAENITVTMEENCSYGNMRAIRLSMFDNAAYMVTY